MQDRSTSQTTTVPKRRGRDNPRRAVDLLAEQLVAAGVDVVFGIPGGAIAPFFDALLDRPEIRVVVTRHESQAVFAAAGYAQTTGKLGVAAVTSGPGTLNTFNALGSAFADGLPVLLLAGEAARAKFGRGAVQEGGPYALNLVGMASHITKLALEVTEPTAVPGALRRAMATALSGKRGPVMLSLPLDVMGEQVTPVALSLGVTTQFELDSGPVAHAVHALSRPGKKVMLVGSGARWDNSPELLVELAEKLECPVMTTPKAKGIFPESHRLSLGIFGMGGHASARNYLDGGFDVLLVIGSSLNEVATDGWSSLLQPRRTLIHVDIDARNIGRVYRTDIGIASPAELFLETALGALPTLPAGDKLQLGVQTDRNAETTATGERGLISAPRALWELQQVLPSDTIYTGDSGANLFFAAHYLTINRPESFVAMLGLGSMGSSLGAAIGAQLGNPDRTVVSICGDGGFFMCGADLSTASAEGLPLIVVVLNDRRLGIVELGNNAIYGRTPPYSNAPLNIPDFARACGADCAVVETPGEARDVLTARRADRPFVLDVRIDPSVRMPANRRFETIEEDIAGKLLN